MKERSASFKRRVLLNWSSLTFEIFISSLLYATLMISGVSKGLSVLISSIFAILLVSLGIVFTYRIYPKIFKKTCKGFSP